MGNTGSARSRVTALAANVASSAARVGEAAAAPLGARAPTRPSVAPPPPPPPLPPPPAARGAGGGSGAGADAGNDSGDVDGTVCVTRLMRSGPPVAGGAALHARDPAHVTNALSLDGTVVQSPLMGAIQNESLALYEDMQRNPALLDTPAALSRSSTAQAALRVLLHARGGPAPPGALLGGGGGGAPPPQQLLLAGGAPPQLPQPVAGGAPRLEPPAPFSAPATAARPVPAPLDEDAAGALVAASESLADVLLLERVPASLRGIVAWGPPPAQATAYDQLLTNVPDDKFMLRRGALFELFARRRANPALWTPERLAEHFQTRVEFVEVLLEVAAPPVFAQVDGVPYGVFEVRALDDPRLAAGATAEPPRHPGSHQ